LEVDDKVGNAGKVLFVVCVCIISDAILYVVYLTSTFYIAKSHKSSGKKKDLVEDGEWLPQPKKEATRGKANKA
jgi:hypothetical protein